MIIPIRCFSCNNPVSRFYLDFVEYKKTGKDLKLFFEDKEIKRYCCRRMLLTHKDTYKVVKHSKQSD